MINLVIPEDVRVYKMSSIYNIVRIDAILTDIIYGYKTVFGLDLNAQYYRIINLRMTDLAHQNDLPEFDFYLNETMSDNPEDALILRQNVVLPFFDDTFNIYGVNREPKNYRDYAFLCFNNKSSDTTIQKIFFSMTIEKLKRGF